MAVCAICSNTKSGNIISSDDLRKAVKNGFNPPMEGLLVDLPLSQYASYDEIFKRMLNQSTGDWNICDMCMSKLKPYLSGSSKSSVKATKRHSETQTQKPKKWWEFWK